MNTTEQPPAITPPTTHTLAIVSLALSILGLLPVLPIVGSIGGIITGMIARKEIRGRSDLYSGEGTATAGIILGWIGMVVVLLLIGAIIAGLLLFNFSGPTRSMLIPGLL